MERQAEAMCHAELLQEGGHALSVGIVLVVVLPLAFAGFVTYFVFVYLYGKRARAAAFILAEDPAQVSALTSECLVRQPLPSSLACCSCCQVPAGHQAQDACTRPSQACS